MQKQQGASQEERMQVIHLRQDGRKAGNVGTGKTSCKNDS